MQAYKHQGFFRHPSSEKEKIKCPDSTFCRKFNKKGKTKKKETPRMKINVEEEVDNPDCPWCRKK